MLGFVPHPNLHFGIFVGWGDEGTPTQPTFKDRKQALKLGELSLGQSSPQRSASTPAQMHLAR